MNEDLNPYQPPVSDVTGETKYSSIYGPVRSTLGLTILCLLSFLLLFGLNVYSDLNHLFSWGAKIQNGFFAGFIIILVVMSLLWVRESVRNAWALKSDEFPVIFTPNFSLWLVFIPVFNLKMLANIWRVSFRTKHTTIILYLWLILYIAFLYCFINKSEVIINYIGMLLAPKVFLASYAAFLFIAFKISREQVKYIGA